MLEVTPLMLWHGLAEAIFETATAIFDGCDVFLYLNERGHLVLPQRVASKLPGQQAVPSNDTQCPYQAQAVM